MVREGKVLWDGGEGEGEDWRGGRESRGGGSEEDGRKGREGNTEGGRDTQRYQDPACTVEGNEGTIKRRGRKGRKAGESDFIYNVSSSPKRTHYLQVLESQRSISLGSCSQGKYSPKNAGPKMPQISLEMPRKYP